MGRRIAEQVRRALIVAAKTAPVVVAIDAAGCGTEPETEYPCAAVCPRDFPCPTDGGADGSSDASKDGS